LMRRVSPPFDFVSGFLEFGDHDPEGRAALVAENIWHILQDETARLLRLQDVENPEEELSLEGVFKPELLTRLGEGLAREAGGQDLMVRHLLGDDLRGIEFIDVGPYDG